MGSINLGRVKGDKGISMRYRGAWNDTAGYVNDDTYIDMAVHDGSLWICKKSNSGYNPELYSEFWEIVAQGQKNSKILWTGYAPPGSTTTFNIPKDCFHNSENTLTLVIEGFVKNPGYAPASDGNAMVSLSFAAASHDCPYAPYTYDGGPYTYITSSEVTSENDSGNGIRIGAKKVADIRYATCDIQNDTSITRGLIITCISAYVPSEA
ncbi:MAG: hypothetical protein SOY12_00675 [Schaedlerella sp.]|nr:hypothetical protein [Lachnospiraceae bacterium]MDY4201574.1 hypothetical protein [Schaedlerella sp.]